MTGWFVAGTHPHQEVRAVENLARQGYRTWLPRYRETRRRGQRFDTRIAPLFPGYVFVGLSAEARTWRPVSSTFGVRQMVCFGGAPAPLPRGFVEDLQARSGADGTVRAGNEELAPGTEVHIVSGPFTGCTGHLVRMESRQRVRLLLSLLGSSISVAAPAEAIAPLA